jgi:ABC-type transport system involved in cytochrome c biogenesis permease component
MKIFLTLTRFEFLQAMRDIYGLLTISLFYLMGLFLCALGISDGSLPAFYKLCFLWVLLLLAITHTLRGFFQEKTIDYLEQLILAPLAIEWFLLAKVLAVSMKLVLVFFGGLPLAFLFLEIPWAYSTSMAFSLCLGTPKKSFLMPFLVFPWQIPAFIFVLGIYFPVAPLVSSQSFYFLAALSLVTVPCSCLISGQILRKTYY